MLPGPIFLHELRVVARRKRSYALRVLLGLFLLYSVVMTYEAWTASTLRSIQSRELSPNEMARLGSNLFGAVLWLQGIVIFFLTPAFLAGAIAEDRQRKVLSYLLASPLTGAEIVLGKLAARVMNLAMLITVGLPVVSLALLFGGIEPASRLAGVRGEFFDALLPGRTVNLRVGLLAAAPRLDPSRLSDRRHVVLPADLRVSARPDGRNAGGDARRGTTGHGVGDDHQPVFLAAHPE